MKKYTIRKASRIGIIIKTDKKGVVCHRSEYMEVSDGYHTMDELYEHRITLFITLCRKMNDLYNAKGEGLYPYRSKKHSDGSEMEGWFIMGLNILPGEQITYHLPMSKWEETNFAETLTQMYEWDKHTSNDVLQR